MPEGAGVRAGDGGGGDAPYTGHSHNGHRPLYLPRPVVRRDPLPPSVHLVARMLVAGAVLVLGAMLLLGVTGALPGRGPGRPLPNGHAVIINLRATSGSAAHGTARLVWYGTGHLLVATITVQGLAPGSVHEATLVPQGQCGGSPLGARVLGRLVTGPSGIAQLNAEVGSLASFQAGRWSIRINAGPLSAGAAAPALSCGVVQFEPLGHR